MARPKKNRTIAQPPLFQTFKPARVRKKSLPKIILSLDEYEALRLADHQGKDHAEAALIMGISRPTFTRLIEGARNKMARLLVEGCTLEIQGGPIHFRENRGECLTCGALFTADLETPPEACPSCGSDNIKDTARGFGHGPCCHSHQRGRNQQKE